MNNLPEAMRLAGVLLDLSDDVSTELHRQHHEIERLHKAYDDLRSAVYWVIEGGEFANWMIGKEMPLGAMKEYDALIKEYADGIPT